MEATQLQWVRDEIQLAATTPDPVRLLLVVTVTAVGPQEEVLLHTKLQTDLGSEEAGATRFYCAPNTAQPVMYYLSKNSLSKQLNVAMLSVFERVFNEKWQEYGSIACLCTSTIAALPADVPKQAVSSKAPQTANRGPFKLAFNLFYKDMLAAAHVQNPAVTNEEVRKQSMADWNTLSSTTRQLYVQKAKNWRQARLAALGTKWATKENSSDDGGEKRTESKRGPLKKDDAEQTRDSQKDTAKLELTTFYVRKRKDEIRKAAPDKSNGSIARQIKREWRSLTVENRRKFLQALSETKGDLQDPNAEPA